MGHALEDTIISRMQNILRVANRLKEVTAVSNSPTYSPLRTSRPPVTIDLINLPSPPPLLASLLEAGLTHEIAGAASEVYQLRSDELRRHVQESIMTACHKIAELPTVALASSADSCIRSVVSSFTQVYLHRLEQWKEEVIRRIKQAPKPLSNAVPRESRTFNHRYVPLLEHFFEENPFPTHADKIFLAKKSNMEYRQIHVWFQNRRSRTKKEGRTLRKKPTYEQATKSLDNICERMKGHTVDSDSQASETFKTISIEITQNNISKDAFTSSPPPHAYPSTYPPTCHYDPFPCKSGPVCFNKPEWRRVPNRNPPPPLSTSTDDLVERFSRLNVRDGTHSKGSPKLQSHAATVAITVIPSPAPHPSLIVRKYIQSTSIVQLRPPVRAPISCSKAFQSSSPTSTPVTLVPSLTSSNKSELPGKRKTAPLPRRFPGRMRNIRRDTTPSESSSTSSSSPRLFSTDSQSYSFFSSASPLPTPTDTASIWELPHLFGSPCRSPLDSPIQLCGLGDMLAILPASVS